MIKKSTLKFTIKLGEFFPIRGKTSLYEHSSVLYILYAPCILKFSHTLLQTLRDEIHQGLFTIDCLFWVHFYNIFTEYLSYGGNNSKLYNI